MAKDSTIERDDDLKLILTEATLVNFKIGFSFKDVLVIEDKKTSIRGWLLWATCSRLNESINELEEINSRKELILRGESKTSVLMTICRLASSVATAGLLVRTKPKRIFVGSL